MAPPTATRGSKVWAAAALLAAPTAHAMPAIQHWQTGKDARVYFLPLPELPMVDIRVLFDAGSAREEGQGLPPGSATLTAALVSEGSGGRAAGEVSAAFEQRGARFNSGVNRQYAEFSLRSLTDKTLLEPVLENFAAVLTEPDFPPEAFERERKRLLVSIQARRQSPGALADEAFYQAVFEGHPYARPVEGDEAGVQAVTLAQLRAFHGSHYNISNMVLIIAGALERAQAEQIATRLVANLPKGERHPPIPPAQPLKEARRVCLTYPSKQAHILIGQPGIDRGSPDYHTLFTGNHLLGGGGMVSRLFERIREEHGLAYSVYSYFQPLRGRGPFVVGMQTEAEQTGEALEMLYGQLRDFVREGPREEELQAARRNLIGGFPLRIDSNSELASYLGVIAFHGLPLDYLEQFPQRIGQVTVEQVHTAFQRHLDPERMVTVLVGPWGEQPGVSPCAAAPETP